MGYPNMVTKIWPDVSGVFPCPVCQTGTPAAALVFQGIHVLTSCTCSSCNATFYHTLPSGHDTLYPIAFTIDKQTAVYSQKAMQWLAKPLLESMDTPLNNIRISKVIKIKEIGKKAIIINCLDTCFGHVFTKLCNSTICKQEFPDYHVIALVPATMSWLLPDLLDEAWLVEAPLAFLNKNLTNVDDFVKNELKRFDEVHLHSTSIYVDMERVDFYDYLKNHPFALENFSKTPYTVTFITREDRFWHRWKVEEMFFLACSKYKLLPYFRWYFCYRQNRLIGQASKQIMSIIKDIRFHVAGLGKTGNLENNIQDSRKETLSEKDEQDWMSLYARSHIVIGVHGSNMIIPSILAAGFIEILPEYKIDHLGEDTMKQYNNRLTQFLCRHIAGRASPHVVARHAISMLWKFLLIEGKTRVTNLEKMTISVNQYK
jgi:hypothetical protein